MVVVVGGEGGGAFSAKIITAWNNHLHSNRFNVAALEVERTFKMKHVGSHYIFNG